MAVWSAAPAARAQVVIGDGVTEICNASWEDAGGQESVVFAGSREVRARANGAAFTTNSSFAEVGMRFVPLAPTTATVGFHGILYQGELRGFGNIQEGSMRIRAIVREVGVDGDLENVVVVEDSENGAPFEQTIRGIDNLFSLDSAEIELGVEPGVEYLAVLRVETQANGTGGRADLLGGGFHVEMGCLTIAADIPDADGDGLLDDWETNGIDIDGEHLDLPGLGADPEHKDIFVELDWMPGQEPTRAAIQAVKDAFELAPGNAGGLDNPDGEEGINLWIDTGGLTDPQASEDAAGPATCDDGVDNGGDGAMDEGDSDCLVGDDLGGGNLIPLADVPNGVDIPKLGGDADGNEVADFYEVKAEHFDAIRRWVFHYAISGQPKSNEDGAGAGSCDDDSDNGDDGFTDSGDVLDCFAGGQAEGGGNDFIDFNHDAATIMHELGHNLGLGHGGDEGDNCKPNYVSVMNYSHQPQAIFQNGGPGTGQDLDGDGIPDGLIVDFSPPRLPGGGRGVAPLPPLNEANLDETTILDSTDTANQFVFINGQGDLVRNPLEDPADWNGVDGIEGEVEPVNLDTSGPSSCENDDLDDDHSGHDDWTNLVLAFLQFGDDQDAPVNPVEDPEPTIDVLDGLLEELNTADLALEKSAPERAMAGQEMVYELTVTNLGPNPASAVRLVDLLPAEVSFVEADADCVEAPAGTLTCELGEIRARSSRVVRVTVRVTLLVDCDEEQLTPIVNRATVANLAGPDPDRSNNRARATTEILCRTVEYAAKIVCGIQDDPADLRLTRGAYATTVNVHNPNSEDVLFFKKLALAYPPAVQEAGEVHPIGIDELAYDEALETDCNDLRQNVFDGELPEPYIEGFVVLQGTRPLDVVAVYTTAALDAEGTPSTHSGIHVEKVPGRRFRPEAADLSIEKRAIFDGSQTSLIVQYTLEVTNEGPTEATGIVVEDTLTAEAGQLVQLLEGTLSVSHDGEWTSTELNEEEAQLLATIPALPAGETATLVLGVEAQVVPPVLEIRLVDTATVTSETPDPDSENNSVTIETSVP